MLYMWVYTLCVYIKLPPLRSSNPSLLMMIVAAGIQLILPTDDKLRTFVAHLLNPNSFTKSKQRYFKKIWKKCLDIRVEQALPNLLRVTITANNGLIELEELKQGYQFPGEKFTIEAMCWPIKYRNSFLRMINNWILTKGSFSQEVSKVVQENIPVPLQVV